MEEEDENGQVVYVNIHPDWSGKSTRNGKPLTVNKRTVKKLFMFNPIQQVVMAQIVASGGIDQYQGQVLWFSMDGRYQYPKPIYDKVVSCLSTDEGLDNVKYRNVRNGFMLSGMFVHKKGVSFENEEYDENGNPIIQKKEDEYDFSKSLDVFQGDENCCSIMDITLNSEDDMPKFINVEGTNYDAKFTVTESSTVERIYAAFQQEPWFCIRTGKLGFSGDVLEQAYEYYNSVVNKERRAISRSLKRIFSCWYKDVNPSGDYEIEPLIYVSNESTN